MRYPFNEAENKIKIHFTIKEDFSFTGIPLLMVHVLFNLLKNALYYVLVAAKGDINIWIEKRERANSLHFKDTGAGIPAKLLPHIFEKFFSRTHHGTGVGLAFCKMMIESFGGRIDCFSEQGEFTEFVLTFPINEKYYH